MTLEWLAPQAALFGLEAARVSGVVIAAPLAWTAAPSHVKVGLVLALTVVTHSVAPAIVRPDDVGATLAAVPAELLVGIAIGMVVRLALAAVQIGAEAIGPVLGLGVASLFDPHADVSETALSQMLRNMALMLALALGLHRVAIGAVLESFRVLPVGSVLRPGAVVEPLVAASVAALGAGMRLAIPVIAVLLVTQVALAFVSRAAPAMQIFSVGFAITMAVGGVTLTLALPDMATAIVEELSRVGPRIDRLLAALLEG